MGGGGKTLPPSVGEETKEEPEATVSLKIPLLLASWCSALEIKPVQGQRGTLLLWQPLKQDEEGHLSRTNTHSLL